MADSKISDLTAVTTPAGTDLFEVAQGGSSKKATLDQVNTYRLKPSLAVQDANFTIPANYSEVIARKHTINSGVILTLGSGAILRIL